MASAGSVASGYGCRTSRRGTPSHRSRRASVPGHRGRSGLALADDARDAARLAAAGRRRRRGRSGFVRGRDLVDPRSHDPAAVLRPHVAVRVRTAGRDRDPLDEEGAGARDDARAIERGVGGELVVRPDGRSIATSGPTELPSVFVGWTRTGVRMSSVGQPYALAGLGHGCAGVRTVHPATRYQSGPSAGASTSSSGTCQAIRLAAGRTVPRNSMTGDVPNHVRSVPRRANVPVRGPLPSHGPGPMSPTGSMTIDLGVPRTTVGVQSGSSAMQSTVGSMMSSPSSSTTRPLADAPTSLSQAARSWAVRASTGAGPASTDGDGASEVADGRSVGDKSADGPADVDGRIERGTTTMATARTSARATTEPTPASTAANPQAVSLSVRTRWRLDARRRPSTVGRSAGGRPEPPAFRGARRRRWASWVLAPVHVRGCAGQRGGAPSQYRPGSRARPRGPPVTVPPGDGGPGARARPRRAARRPVQARSDRSSCRPGPRREAGPPVRCRCRSPPRGSRSAADHERSGGRHARG